MTINECVSPEKPLFAEVHNVPDDYRFTTEELDRIIAGDMFTPRQGAIMARELQQYRVSAVKPSACIDRANLDYLESGAGADVWPASEADSDDVLLYAAPQLPQPVPERKAITKHFDTIALDTAKMVMCDVNRRNEFFGGDIQLLSRIQCRVDEACRAAMLQGAEPVSQPCTLRDGWVAVPLEPTEEMLDEFDSIIDYGAEDSKDAWSRLIAAAPLQEVKP